MFSLNVVDTDKFLEMPISSRLLYYELGMRADDDGFVDNWKKILLFTGLKEDDMKVLISKQFILPFKSGIIVIRHWRLNNYLQKDRTKPTIYQDELKMLDISNGGEYFMKKSIENKDYKEICIQNTDNMYTQYSIDKNSIDKIRLDENSIDIYSPADKIPYKEIIDYLNFKTNSNYKLTTKKTKELIKARFNEGFNLEDFKIVIDKKTNEWLNDKNMQQYLRPVTLFGTKFESYLNQPQRKRTLKDISLKELEEMENETDRIYSTNEDIGIKL